LVCGEGADLAIFHDRNSPWFYGLDLLGTLAFGIAGFIRTRERQYDL
jgi:hypothetical protein